MKRRSLTVLLGLVVLALLVGTPAASGSPRPGAHETVTVRVTSANGSNSTSKLVRSAGPDGELLLCDKFYAFADKAGEFTLQHQCGGNTAPWGYRVAPQLRAIAVGPVAERGVDWTRDGVRQPRMAPHLEGADYTFHGTFPNSPDGTTITYSDHLTFRHGMNGGGEVDIDIKGAFTLTGNRA